VAENLGDHGGIFNEPAEGAARMVKGPPHWDRYDLKELSKKCMDVRTDPESIML